MTTGECAVPRDLVAVFHASFHRTQGSIIDWSVKASEDIDLSNVEFSCLPSGLHLVDRDVVYFTKDDYQGVCVFRRRRTPEDGHRGFRLSSLGILLSKSTRARPWAHVAALKTLVSSLYDSLEDRDTLEPMDSDWEPVRAFFDERRVAEPRGGCSSSWEGWASELDETRSDSAPTVHLPHLLRILGPSSLTLYKHILGRRRVLIVTIPPVEAACILCHVAADTCFQEQVSEAVSTYDDDSREDDDDIAPLKGKNAAGVKVLGMVTLNDLDKLDFESKSGRGWIACTTDAIFLDKPAYYDLLIDLRSATPNTRPTFYVPKAADQPSGRGPTYRLSTIRFTWSDVRLWTELDRVLQSESEDHPDMCCDPSHLHSQPRNSTSSSWTDVWRVYEDVCVMCAGLWMGAWRASSGPTNASFGPPYASFPRRAESWNSNLRLDGGPDDDAISTRTRSESHVRALGQGIEGRPPPPANGRTSRALRRVSTNTLSALTRATKGNGTDPPRTSTSTLTMGKGTPSVSTSVVPVADIAPTPSSQMFIPGERGRQFPDAPPPPERRARQVATTLALLDAFHAHTSAVLTRFSVILETRRWEATSGGLVCLTPKDVMSFELGPFSGLDARFVEWLGEEYGGGVRVCVKRGWKDLVGLVLGFG
ncbi:uncharacterized protein BXZ73DRAFT_89188 [Epithele typhae]|uniref:uncharacterized protein n=1 Tax=Epithele typhae TaxID=378194 RepID=UPI0020082286|nr:uncharacterized protein BXZ73DRAFT_89188 [Epithele typhae]KAH9938813.1 hypothetical protein BXZ73DRAFT_89188 [Epithele typhae]